jgi:type IV pilus assembly protein PilM
MLSIAKTIEKIKKISFPSLKFTKKSYLGIDIGTSAIKIAELSKRKNRKNLENYGEIRSEFLYGKIYRTSKGKDVFLSNEEIAKAIKEIISTAKMKSRDATFALPDFASFFTRFDLPPMTKEELPEAVKFAARRYIPLPLSEVVLDWQVLKERQISKNKRQFHILLIAVPLRTVQQYQEIANKAELENFALEAEVFSLIRALIKEKEAEKKSVCLIDIGAQTTSVSIVEKGNLLISRSFDDFSGNILTTQISRSLNVSLEEAEDLKTRFGLTERPEDLKSIMLPLINNFIDKVKRILEEYSREADKGSVEQIILTGGGANLLGLKEYLTSEILSEVKISNPFGDIFYPSVLEDKLEEMGASFSVAIGAASRKIV